MIGKQYSYRSLGAAAYHYMRMRLNLAGNHNPQQIQKYIADARHYKHMICSQFVAKTYAVTLQAVNPLDVPGGLPSPVYTPADIYVNLNLDTVGGPP